MDFKKENEEIIDLTTNPFEYPTNLKKIYNNNLIKKRKVFINWLGLISLKNAKNLDWWLLNPVSRDPTRSNLFHNFCLLESLEDYLKKNKKKKLFLTVDEFIFNAIKKKKKKNIFFRKKKTKRNKLFILNSIYFLKFVIKSIIIFLVVKTFSKKKKFEKPILLIDTFINYSNNKITNIYGNDFERKVNKIKEVFFVPTFAYVGLFKLIKILPTLLKNKSYIFKEEFLSFFDFFTCLIFFIKRKKFINNFLKLKNWDLSEKVNEEISIMNSSDSIIGGLINYRFAKALSKKKIKVKKTVNWFENQSPDKGWNLGFKKYYNNCKVLGYQGSVYLPQFEHLCPTHYEFGAKIIPDEIIVIGNAYKKIRKEFCSKVKITTGPAIRFNKNLKISRSKKMYHILFVLSGVKEYDEVLLEKAIFIANKIPKQKIFIKFHSILPFSKLKKYKELPFNILEISGSLADILNKTKNVISAGPTSAILECLIYSCNLVIYKVSLYEEILVKKIKLPKKFYTIINNDLELGEYVDKFFVKKNKLNQQFPRKLKENLFQKESKNNLNLLLK